MGLERRTRLVSRAPLRATPGYRLAAVSKRRRRERAAGQPAVEAMYARDGGCVLAGHQDQAGRCFGRLTPHHLVKQSRERGGWTAANLVALCVRHNEWVENGDPALAHRWGLVVRWGETLEDAWGRMRAAGLLVGDL